MKNKKYLPIIITSLVAGAVFIGIGILAIIKLTGKKDAEKYELDYPDIKEYFEERAEIVSVTPVKDSKNTLSEQSAVEELRSRGFTEYPITADYTIDGGFDDPVDASEDSSVKHPMYLTYYVDSRNQLWVITVVDGRVSAAPSLYNLEHEDKVPIELSESEEIASYDLSTNSIYITIPKTTVMDVRVVDRIDASTLESFDLEG